MNTPTSSSVRCGVLFCGLGVIAGGSPARHIGTIAFDLLRPPFKHRRTDKGALLDEQDLARVRYLMPSGDTICYVVLPRRDAILGALREHAAEQDLDSPAWHRIITAIQRELS